MKKLFIVLAFTCIYFNGSLLAAEEVSKEMQDVYAAFKKLQVYLAQPASFEDSKNQKEIQALLQTISKKFHTVDEMGSRYQNQPGFKANAKLVHEMLDDSLKRFNEGEKSYSLWRLRGLTNHCATCHVTYNVNLAFHDKPANLDKISPIERANFYYSTRQFEEASEAYLEAVKDNKFQVDTIEALRKWLIVQTRVNANPKEAEKTLAGILPKLQLPTYELEEVKAWEASLRSWSQSKEPVTGLQDAERLIRQAVSPDPLADSLDEVTLLRATAVLHNILPALKAKEDRSRALYLLGLGYSKLPSFFIDELPEVYLILSIEEMPGSKSAKSSFELYKNIVTFSFTGSAGTDIPEDIKLKLIDLHKKAYNIPAFTGKI